MYWMSSINITIQDTLHTSKLIQYFQKTIMPESSPYIKATVIVFAAFFTTSYMENNGFSNSMERKEKKKKVQDL